MQAEVLIRTTLYLRLDGFHVYAVTSVEAVRMRNIAIGMHSPEIEK